MVIREQVTIRASCEDVWPFVADPVRVAEWNPKLVSVERSEAGPLQLGERFRQLYRMSGRDRETECEVVELVRPSIFVVEHRPVGWDPGRYVHECYRLEPVREGTRIVQEIDFSRSGIAWPWRLLMWVLHRTGEPTGKRYLVKLKDLMESKKSSFAPPTR